MQKKIRQNFLFSSLLKFKRLLNSVIVLRNSATFPFSVSFWSNIFVEYVQIHFYNKQNHIPHKFLCCFRITFTNFPRSLFPSPLKVKNYHNQKKAKSQQNSSPKERGISCMKIYFWYWQVPNSTQSSLKWSENNDTRRLQQLSCRP